MKDEFLLRKIKQLGKKFGYKLVDANLPGDLFVELIKYRSQTAVAGMGREHEFLAYVLANWNKSKSQFFQDLFVLFMNQEKQDGYFVEFGATNGITLSNSWLLETGFGWKGILAEPARNWHDDLRKNRQAIIETRCVWSKSGERLEFNEVNEGELSTIDAFSNSDGHSAARQSGSKYMVETISLNDLLETCSAPGHIDYMSVDTEGSELTILSHFDFSKYQVGVITVEHNYTPDRQLIHDLLVAQGFVRVLEKFSQCDDWYINAKQFA